MRSLRSLLLIGAVLCGVSAYADDRDPPSAPPPGEGAGGQQGPAGHGPPQAALTACASLASGAACTFTDRGHEMTGTCGSPSSDKALACRPAGGPHR